MKSIEQAMKKLKRIKVGKLYDDDIALPKEQGGYEQQFDRTWWMVLHELDLYREGEYEEGEHLDKKSAETAYKWLKETQHLTIEFKNTKF